MFLVRQRGEASLSSLHKDKTHRNTLKKYCFHAHAAKSPQICKTAHTNGKITHTHTHTRPVTMSLLTCEPCVRTLTAGVY